MAQLSVVGSGYRPRMLFLISCICGAMAFGGAERAVSAPVAEAAVIRIAILDIECTRGLDTQEIVYLSDLVRGASRRALPDKKYIIMTRDNIFDLLPAGTTLQECAGDCAVTVGRKVGADYVIAGELFVLEGERKLALSLYSTDDANLVNNVFITAKDLAGLEGQIKQATAELVSPLGILAAAGVTAKVTSAADPWRHDFPELKITEIITVPQGATVLVDGKPFCSATPCKLELPVGSHSVDIMLDDYHNVQQTISLEAAGPHSFTFTLRPRFALVRFVTSPDGIELRLNGKELGKSPVAAVRVPQGEHYVEISDRRYQVTGTRFTAVEAGDMTVDIEATARLGAVQISALDSQGQPVEAVVDIDGIKAGRTPYTGNLIVGRHDVVVGTGDEVWSGYLEVEEESERKETVRLSLRSPRKHETTASYKSEKCTARGSLFLAATKDGAWAVPQQMVYDAPWGASLGAELIRGRFGFGVGYSGYFVGVSSDWSSGATATDALSTCGASVRGVLYQSEWSLYLLGGAHVAWGGIAVGTVDYLDSWGVSTTEYVQQDLDGLGHLMQCGVGCDVPLYSLSASGGYASIYLEYALMFPRYTFSDASSSFGSLTAAGMEFNESYSQFRLGLRWFFK